MENVKEKIKVFAELLENQSKEWLKAQMGEGYECNINYCKVSIKEGKKYTKIDMCGSGKYMIDTEGNIFGIKAYGVIHKEHIYGNLDTLAEYYWGDYKAYKI